MGDYDPQAIPSPLTHSGEHQMPLSENEQRILRQIEQQLESDPTFSTRGYRIPRRRLVGLTLGLIAVFVATVMMLSVSVWLAIGGFVVAVAVGAALEREIRVLARERIGVLPISAWLGAKRRQR
ncbi:hypothetical protein BH24ACT5_BH24ACT5_23770 [soil metagenome]